MLWLFFWFHQKTQKKTKNLKSTVVGYKEDIVTAVCAFNFPNDTTAHCPVANKTCFQFLLEVEFFFQSTHD